MGHITSHKNVDKFKKTSQLITYTRSRGIILEALCESENSHDGEQNMTE